MNDIGLTVPTTDPRHWQDQYELMGGTVLNSFCIYNLLEVLDEHIKKSFLTKKECKGPKVGATGDGSSKKKMVSFNNQIPKKSRRM